MRAYADADGLNANNAAVDVIDRVVGLDTFHVASALADYER